MKEHAKNILTVSLAIIVAAVILFGLWTLHEDHLKTTATYDFISQQLANAKAQQATQTAK